MEDGDRETNSSYRESHLPCAIHEEMFSLTLGVHLRLKIASSLFRTTEKALQRRAEGPSIHNEANYAVIVRVGFDPHSP